MKKTLDEKVFGLICYTVMTIVALLCLVPFLLVVISSLTDEQEIIKRGFSLFPHKLSLAAYKFALKDPLIIIRAYGVTISVTVLGTLAALLAVSMTSYVLQRKDFAWRNKFSFYIYFTTLFNGGLVPYYIFMIRYLHMKNNLLALILPLMLNAFNIILMRSYLSSIPTALIEAARIDGAGDFQIYWKIILPLAKPALATIGLFIALGYWNDWYSCMLFIDNDKLFTLQYYLYRMVNGAEAMRTISTTAGGKIGSQTALPSEALKMALTVIVTGPILLLYPFVQRYFVSGLTVGAVKQ